MKVECCLWEVRVEGGPPDHQRAWKKEWGNFRKRTWHTWKSLALSVRGFCDNLEGREWAGCEKEIQKGWDTCTPMVHSCWCTTEIKPVLSSNHKSIKNKQKKTTAFWRQSNLSRRLTPVAADSRLSVRRGMADLTDLLCRLVFSSQSRLTAPLSFSPAGMAVKVATEWHPWE